MRKTVYICDASWRITRVLCDGLGCGLAAGEALEALLEDPDQLSCGLEDLGIEEAAQDHQALMGFAPPALGRDGRVLIHSYPHHYLVFAFSAADETAGLELVSEYIDCVQWADENLQTPYSDGYGHIQALNNKLINAERTLMAQKAKLERLLEERERALRTIEDLEHDEVTGLLNTRGFVLEAQRLLADAKAGQYQITVIYIEGFRVVNEVQGTASADKLLLDIGAFMRGFAKDTQCLLARIYSSTYYMLGPADAHLSEDALQRTQDFLRAYPVPVRLKAHAAAYVVKNPSLPVLENANRARLALEHARNDSGGRVAYYDDALRRELQERFMLLDHVDEAVAAGEFLLYLQPKVDIRTGALIGAEALIRWQHPQLGFLTPNRFVPLLESEGVIYQVDLCLWEMACAYIQERRQAGLPCVPISVNVARADLYEDGLPDELDAMLARHGLAHDDIRLEILERSYAQDAETVGRVIARLKERGFKIEMDDFGTGDSSLAMLSQMPVDALKIDQSFLRAGEVDERKKAILRLIVELAHTLDIPLIVEGVETQEHVALLCELGCRYAQGYLFGRPAPADAKAARG